MSDNATIVIMIRLALIVGLLLASHLSAQSTSPASTQSVTGIGKLPHIDVDVAHKKIRVECEALHVVAPLEFFACVTGTSEHEAVVRSAARPSHLHLALIMLGLEPGRSVHYDEQNKKWIEPSGPPLKLSVEFEKDGKQITCAAHDLMRDIKTQRPMPDVTWVFTGSRIMPDQTYGADRTGYLVSIVNFELSPIDFPALASNANETLEWQTNLDKMPPAGTKMTLIIEPAEKVIPPPAGTPPKPPATAPSP